MDPGHIDPNMPSKCADRGQRFEIRATTSVDGTPRSAKAGQEFIYGWCENMGLASRMIAAANKHPCWSGARAIDRQATVPGT
jgi:hypothetical protein